MIRSALVATAMIAVCLAVFACVESDAADPAGIEKYNKLLASSKQVPMMYVDAPEFERYVARGPRPYTVIAVLTSRFRCDMCE
jgi:hypothetical protein